MMASYAVTINGRMSMALEAQPERTLGEELTAGLHGLDGQSAFAYLLWRLPDGVPFADYDCGAGPDEYIQCAGGMAGRFTCEIRVASGGGFRHYVIGRSGETDPQPTWEVLRWDAYETPVRKNEVLSASEVAELFRAYLAGEIIPAAYECRELMLVDPRRHRLRSRRLAGHFASAAIEFGA